MAINNNAKNEILKAFKVLTKAKIIETPQIKLDPSISWESNTKDLSWSVGNGTAISSFETYSILANKDPNALYLESEIGVIKTNGSSNTKQVEWLEDAILEGKKGVRGYDETYGFVATQISGATYDILKNAGISNTTENIGSGVFATKESLYTHINTNHQQALGTDLTFIIRGDTSSGYEYILVFGSVYMDYDAKYDHEATKYETVYPLSEHTTPMEFLANSTISTKINVSMVEQI